MTSLSYLVEPIRVEKPVEVTGDIYLHMELPKRRGGNFDYRNEGYNYSSDGLHPGELGERILMKVEGFMPGKDRDGETRWIHPKHSNFRRQG